MLGCRQPSKDKTVAEPVVVKAKPIIVDTIKKVPAKPIDVDSLANYYIAHAKNELVAMARKETTVKEEALFDQEEKIGSTNYQRFNIGHDFIDEDGARFISDSWIYIDSATGKIFESDPNGALIKWSN
ncbi:hypothetical protein [Mucilaginibacter flavus]|uniref:hypothetical protein n=1 Tax=Mucilaginibacter flavus TaxID=931504 RepID=UPI0025B325E1|nr:hypothetical protein [Mucilaginibacter flavus]MDN3582439.1 hypothetical protein [Mucilaginibacter flavus]